MGSQSGTAGESGAVRGAARRAAGGGLSEGYLNPDLHGFTHTAEAVVHGGRRGRGSNWGTRWAIFNRRPNKGDVVEVATGGPQWGPSGGRRSRRFTARLQKPESGGQQLGGPPTVNAERLAEWLAHGRAGRVCILVSCTASWHRFSVHFSDFGPTRPQKGETGGRCPVIEPSGDKSRLQAGRNRVLAPESIAFPVFALI